MKSVLISILDSGSSQVIMIIEIWNERYHGSFRNDQQEPPELTVEASETGTNLSKITYNNQMIKGGSTG